MFDRNCALVESDGIIRHDPYCENPAHATLIDRCPYKWATAVPGFQSPLGYGWNHTAYITIRGDRITLTVDVHGEITYASLSRDGLPNLLWFAGSGSEVSRS